MSIIPINATKVFKPSGENVRVLLISSTSDTLGEYATSLIRSNLNSEIVVVDEDSTVNFSGLNSIISDSDDFNVLVFVAHGKKDDNTTRLSGDMDSDGRILRLNVAQLATALKGKVNNILCLFGVCYLGTDDLAEAVCVNAGALACIAPKPTYAITCGNIGTAFSSLLNKMQESKQMDFNIDLLHEYLLPCLDQNLLKELSIFPAKV